MRYFCEPDVERFIAGWGEHYWIIDSTKIGIDSLVRLLPAREAEAEATQLNIESKYQG